MGTGLDRSTTTRPAKLNLLRGVAQVVVVLGIPLSALTVDQAVARGLQGGLVLAPSGPGLADLSRDHDYRDALLASDLNLTDSGFVLLARLMRGHRLATRTSGFRYLHGLLRHPSMQASHGTYWVMPSPRPTHCRGQLLFWGPIVLQ